MDPLNKRVLVEPEDTKTKEQKTPGGIIIPGDDSAVSLPGQTKPKAPTKGRVIAVAGDSDIKFKITSGDIVLFSKYSYTEIIEVSKIPGQKDRQLFLIKDEDILAVIRSA